MAALSVDHCCGSPSSTSWRSRAGPESSIVSSCFHLSSFMGSGRRLSYSSSLVPLTEVVFLVRILHTVNKSFGLLHDDLKHPDLQDPITTQLRRAVHTKKRRYQSADRIGLRIRHTTSPNNSDMLTTSRTVSIPTLTLNPPWFKR